MTVIIDIDFKDTHSLADAMLSVSREVPTDVNIGDGFLNVIAGEILFNTGLSEGDSVVLILKDASGEAVLNDRYITPLQPANLHKLRVGRDGTVFLSVRGDVGSCDVRFSFSGYRLVKQ